jgi:carboxymethylenebutenolidase
LTETTIPLSQPEPTVELTPKLRAPVLFLIGEADHLYTAAQRTRVETALRDAGVRHEFVSYPDTPHGFFADERDSYRPAVAADAWARMSRFLDNQLTR